MCAERIALLPGRNTTDGPAEETRRACATLIGRDLTASHACIEDLASLSEAAVVGAEVDDQCVVLDAPLLELREQCAEVRVDVLNHTEELRDVLRHAGFAEILLIVFLRQDPRAVRRI